MMKTLFYIIGTAVCVVALSAPGVRAQQQTPDQGQPQTPDQGQPQTPDQGPAQPAAPIPAYRSPLASAANNDDEDTETELTPDTRALTGVQNLSLGNSLTHSYWQPHVDIFSTVDSNPQVEPGQSTWGTWISATGGVDLHRVSGNSVLTLSYVGGGMLSTDSGANNGVVQGLNFSDRYLFRRWAILFLEQLNYSPGSSFGLNGLDGSTYTGGGSSGTGSVFNPGQPLLTGQGQILQNSFNTEVDTFLTARTSLTFVGGYSLGHYFQSDLFDYGNVNFRAGYNYQMDRKNTIGLSYTFSEYNYSNSAQSITSHTAQVSYGRRVTGRLAFQVAAGPQVSFSHEPITGTVSSGGGAAGGPGETSATLVNWSLSANLRYQWQRTGLALTYNHGVQGGYGLLSGSLTDNVSGSVTRQVSRTFSSGITGGYSRSQGQVIGAAMPSNQSFDYWYGGANLSHPIGRTLALTLAYQVQYQTSNAAFCFGPTCGTSLVRNLISFGVGWHERPLLF
jgi:hypothetical protein